MEIFWNMKMSEFIKQNILEETFVNVLCFSLQAIPISIEFYRNVRFSTLCSTFYFWGTWKTQNIILQYLQYEVRELSKNWKDAGWKSWGTSKCVLYISTNRNQNHCMVREFSTATRNSVWNYVVDNWKEQWSWIGGPSYRKEERSLWKEKPTRKTPTHKNPVEALRSQGKITESGNNKWLFGLKGWMNDECFTLQILLTLYLREHNSKLSKKH